MPCNDQGSSGQQSRAELSQALFVQVEGFDADQRLFSLFPPVFRLIRASMG
jgi:hypothetical protein